MLVVVVVVVIVVAVVVIPSYHGLINLQYKNQTEKSATAKRLLNAQGISMSEAEWQLDTDAYLQGAAVMDPQQSLPWVPASADVSTCHGN